MKKLNRKFRINRIFKYPNKVQYEKVAPNNETCKKY